VSAVKLRCVSTGVPAAPLLARPSEPAGPQTGSSFTQSSWSAADFARARIAERFPKSKAGSAALDAELTEHPGVRGPHKTKLQGTMEMDELERREALEALHSKKLELAADKAARKAKNELNNIGRRWMMRRGLRRRSCRLPGVMLRRRSNSTRARARARR
jgi:hypothetical protein